MRLGRSVAFVCAAVLGFCTVSAGALPSQAAAVRTEASNLSVPWEIDFLPDATALITERSTFRVLRLSGSGASVLRRIQDAVGTGSTGGLLGLAVSPHYESDKSVFVYYSTTVDNRVVRLTGDSAPVAVLAGIPRGEAHNGGRIAFGPDGYLYVATGDAMAGPRAQDLISLAGKILRITGDGRGAPDNPFPTAPLVYSYGHRDVEGLAWDDRGHMYATELGDEHWDEVNRIEPGRNYGWPVCEGRCAVPNSSFVDPLIQWNTEEASPSGAAYYHGNLYVAALKGQRMWRIPVLEDGELGEPGSIYQNYFGRLRAVVAGPDDRLWFSTSNRDQRGVPGPQGDLVMSSTG
ncbi:PQQ-dependent sugar dehydrogenase [Kutzneria viridogrisea]|uniref:Glucose dehydrogenase n=2 Tax=Kutzneria TaxID=43356 RepID=W5WFM8_9PSEU|nr:PQQ-dependent sugar dehydrogenase [Kutzneria albida]AHH96979.1 glucose dehydrogenase [Kutzneria albida DSM 43870]MBA8932056.1 glucose/arabinose dehydrogenase [Kutzneria viridogrisea]